MYESDLEQYVQRFEDAWQKNGSADISDFLPPSDHPDHDEITVELIRCEMELSWEDFDDRKLENYRDRFPDVLNNSQLLEQVAFEEYRLRTQSGEQVSANEYQQRYEITTYHWPELKESPVAGHRHESDTFSELPTHKSDVDSSAGRDISSRFGSGIKLPDLTTVENRLHKRLRFISLTFAVLLIYLALLSFANPDEKVGLFLEGKFLVGLNTFCLAACVAVTIFLWARSSISLYYLRILEVCLFGRHERRCADYRTILGKLIFV